MMWLELVLIVGLVVVPTVLVVVTVVPRVVPPVVDRVLGALVETRAAVPPGASTGEITELRRRIEELEERVDSSERLLAQQRERGLPPAGE